MATNPYSQNRQVLSNKRRRPAREDDPTPDETVGKVFGEGIHNVVYEMDEDEEAPLLEIPQLGDSLETVARKLSVLGSVVMEGKSLAVTTGSLRSAHTSLNAEELARTRMKPMEVYQWDAFKEGIVIMPEFDWENNRKAIEGGPASIRRFEKRGRAMGRLWKYPNPSAEHARWLTANMVHALPLVMAVTKVENVERELADGFGALDKNDLAEMQTAHKIIAVATDVMNEHMRLVRINIRDINQAKEILQAREYQLRQSLPEWLGSRRNQLSGYVDLQTVTSNVLENQNGRRERTGPTSAM